MKVNIYTTFGKASAGRFPQEMAHAIASSGIEVVLIAPHAEPIEFERFHPLLSRLVLLDVVAATGKFARICQLVARTAWSFAMLAKARQRSRFYVITFIGQIPSGLLHILWLRLLGARIVHVVHDPSPHAWAFPPRVRWLERAMLLLSYWLSERLVTLTETGRRELVDLYGCSAVRIDVVPHGALVPPRIVPLTGDGQILLFGSLRRNKCILQAIRAFNRFHSRFPRLRLLIAGDPHREDRSYWQECAEEIAGADGPISTEIGFVDEARLNQLIEMSDGVLLAYEAFNSQSGVAILSSFCERVVLSTSAGGLGELKEMGLRSIEIDVPVTEETIAGALERFSALSVDELRWIAEQSRLALEDKLEWGAIGRQYARLLQDMVVGKNASSAADTAN